MTMKKFAVGTLACGIAFGLGCQHQGRKNPNHVEESDRDRDHDEGHDEQRAASPEIGSGLSSRSAVRSIATSRCEREERCGNVGVDKDYATVDACETKIKAEWNEDLNKYECPNGIVDAELDECLNDIRTEDCGNPFDTIARVASCSASDICRD
jgi:hypothetical protein